MSWFEAEPVDFADVVEGDWIQARGVWDLPAKVVLVDCQQSYWIIFVEGQTVGLDGSSRAWSDRLDWLPWQRVGDLWVRYPNLRGALGP